MSGLDFTVETQPTGPPANSLLDELEPVFAVALGTEHESAALIAAARARASAVSHAAGEAAGTAGLGGAVFVAEVLSGLALERDWPREEADALLEHAAEVMGLSPDVVRVEVSLLAVRDPRLLELPPRLALQTQLKLVFLLTRAIELSLWTAIPGKRLQCAAHVGGEEPSRGVRAEARRLLEGTPNEENGNHSGVHALPVLLSQQPHAALALRVRPEDREQCLVVAAQAAQAMGVILEKEALLQPGPKPERALVEATERRLARLGFDLHDGPIQDIAVLASDIRLLRQQLADVLATHEHRDRLVGRVDDLEARLRAIDGDLRELSRSFESPALLKKPFPQGLRHEIDAFASKTKIAVKLHAEGEFTPLTDSQRIALLRIVQEALTNVREHSGASEVRVSIVGNGDRVDAEIEDNGHGFDVEQTLIRAAKEGRLGLVGMSERVRLLGGRFDVRSKPGGPTTISVTLPEWRPGGDDEPAADGDSSGDAG